MGREPLRLGCVLFVELCTTKYVIPSDMMYVAQEGGQDGPKGRGAAGTPHNIALARAIAEAQLSPLQVCSFIAKSVPDTSSE